ncbi:MAG: hypothetical protein DWI04_05085 [Planctomycetota bacterium]|jgi:hypothetical protein|nr:MAG: hypothetical protein DWI04_05085 [Planctomycetota bacterium]
MPLKSLGHTIEKQILRPLFRRVRKLTRISGAHDRIAALESRIERLESLFREQAGLHYLRLMDDQRHAETPAGSSAPRRDSA